MKSIEVENQDFYSFVGSISKRLQLYGESLLGVAHQGGETFSTESIDELGAMLCQDSRRLATARGALCDRCRLHDVVEKIEVRIVNGSRGK